MERMENDRIAGRVYAGSCVVGRPQKRWIDTVKECLRKRSLDVRQAWRMAQDRCEGECMGFSLVDEPVALTKCQSCELTQLYEALEG